MTPASIDRVFGTSRLKMVTGQYVDVYREAAAPGQRRRYTKRFLSTQEGDFREWTEREWRILARLVGHGAKHVPDVVQYDRGASGGDALVQTYDAGVTLDHWVSLLPVQRGGRLQRHIFQDCAHWWALARHLLLALHEIHALQLVHLDLKADNICLPFAPPGFDPTAAQQTIYPVFEQIALIDFAFSLISGEALTKPLPIGWQRRFPYQSPRLLQALVAGHDGDLEPTRRLDWRCDMYSLAAMLNCVLPSPDEVHGTGGERGWSDARYADAKTLLLKIRDSHDQQASAVLPHLGLAADCAVQLQAADLIRSLDEGWTLADEPAGGVDALAPTAPLTPVTLIEPHPGSVAAVTEIYLPPDGAHDSAAHDAAVQALPAPMTSGAPSSAAVSTTSPDVYLPAAQQTALAAAVTPIELPDAGLQPAPPPPPPPSPSPPPVGRRAASRRLALALPLLALLAIAGRWQFGTPTAGNPDAPSAPVAERADGAEVIVSNRAGDSAPAVPDRIGRNAADGTAASSGSPAAAGPAVPAVTPAPTTTTPPMSSTPTPATPTAPAPAATTTPAPAITTIPAPAVTTAPPPTTTATPTPAVPTPTPPTPRPEPPAVQVAQQPAPAPVGERAAGMPTAGLPTGDDRLTRRARVIAADVMPVVVARATPRVARVLSAAAQAQDVRDDRRTVEVAGAVGDVVFGAADGLAGVVDVAQGRQLNAAAHTAFWQRGDAARAYELQWQAFGAHPHDPEIAGNLAFYALKVSPRQVEIARNLAIYALAAATRGDGATRLEDWGNLAVASALSGRPADAANAMLVLMAVSKDVNRSCRSALSSVATFGPALQAPAQALLARANDRGNGANAPNCDWPPRWIAKSEGSAAASRR